MDGINGLAQVLRLDGHSERVNLGDEELAGEGGFAKVRQGADTHNGPTR